VEVYAANLADFQVVSSKANTTAGANNSHIEVTYRNVGNEPITDVVARLRFFDPVSSMDDQAYLGQYDSWEGKDRPLQGQCGLGYHD
jgi:hypothetical protein